MIPNNYLTTYNRIRRLYSGSFLKGTHIPDYQLDPGGDDDESHYVCFNEVDDTIHEYDDEEDDADD